jgi:hypothetical protein
MSGLPIGSIHHPEMQGHISWRDSITPAFVAYTTAMDDPHIYESTHLRCRNVNCTAETVKDYRDPAGDYYEPSLTGMDPGTSFGQIRGYDYSEVRISGALVKDRVVRIDESMIIFTGGESYIILGAPVPKPGPINDVNRIGTQTLKGRIFEITVVNHIITGEDHVYRLQDLSADNDLDSGFFFGEPSAPRGFPP